MSIQIKQTEFNLTPLFTDDHDSQMTVGRMQIVERAQAFIAKWKERVDYLTDKNILCEVLDEYETFQRLGGAFGNEGYYFWLRSEQDENNPDLKARLNGVTDFSTKIANDLIFLELNLAKIVPERQAEFLTASELVPYRGYLEAIFKVAKFLLSEPEEKILNLKSQPAYHNWIKMLSGFLSMEEREVLLEDGTRGIKNLSELSTMAHHKQKAVRDEAAGAIKDIIAKHLLVAENELNAILADKKINDELRGYTRPDESRHVQDNIETAAVDVLIEAVSDRFDISQKYYQLKARLFGVEKLEYHERNLEYGEITKKYSYEESVALVQEVLGVLDGEFVEIFRDFVERGAIDVYPRKGKRGGAFCAHHQLTQPTYILLNHNDELRDVTTLAHEVGHGINNELTRKTQNALNFGTSTATAEVASTFMEDFVLEQILREADDELRLTIMVAKLDDVVASIFRQVALYKFEQELHAEFRAKGYLSKEQIGTLFTKHMYAYLGEGVNKTVGVENSWVSWNHIRYFFYVYSYAGGLLISKSLQNSVKADPVFIKKVKTFLASGISASPREIFADLGIDIMDISFWQKGLAEIEKLLIETTKLAEKLRKI